MGGPDMAPQTPQRSEHPGDAAALLVTATALRGNGAPDMAPQPPQRSEHPCSAVGAPHSDRLLALRARFFDVEHLRHGLRRVAQLEPVDTFQPIEDRLDA